MDRVSIGGTIVASFGFIAPAWRSAWGILAIAVIFQGGLAAVQALPPGFVFLSFIGIAIGLFVGTAVLGALYRVGIGPDHGADPEFAVGAGGLQWGNLEWRVMGANVLIGVIFAGIFFVAAIIWVIALAGSMAGNTEALQGLSGASGPAEIAALMHLMAGPAGVATAAVLLPTIGLTLWLGAKLGVFAVMAADTRSLNIGQAWTLSRGAVWALIVTSVIIFIVELLIGGALGAAGGVLDVVSGHGATGARTWAGVVGQGIAAAVNAPLSVGMQLFVYRAKRGGAAAVAATFS